MHTDFPRLHLSMERWERPYLWGASSWLCMCCTAGLCQHHGCFTQKTTACAPSWSLVSVCGMKINTILHWSIHLWKSLVALSISQSVGVGCTLWREGMNRGELSTCWAMGSRESWETHKWWYGTVAVCTRRKAGLKSALAKAKGKC